ncbi:MAG: hypothetical protein KAW51_00910 [Candidatus Lokiarchaeota archaeon]|nr:hypothetical protein [Candidatus Lokiarchaeota archaeon]
MEDKREEDFDKEFDDEELDLTKDAFFSDMVEMEEEIASEAYELVEHAINLINSHYYDDGIEILRQAIGLYTQINREDEIKAINDKISEIYILKEKTFREDEIEAEKEVEVTEVIEEAEVVEKVETIEEEGLLEETKNKADLISRADQLIVEAHQLANFNKFEEALDKYDEAEKILEELGKSDEIERIYPLIEDCYNKKAEYLRVIKKEEQKELVIGEESELPLSEEQLKEKKLKQYLETKKREEEISSKGYEILDKAVELAKLHDYDQAMSLYKEGATLFKKLNWTYETKKILDTIEQLEKEKIAHFQALEREKVHIEQKIEKEIQKEKVIDQHVKELEDQEKLAQMERVRGIELQKMEREFFKAQIDNMVTEATRMAREYELAMQKAIKDGKLVEECLYPKVIEIYKKIEELLLDKGWNSEAEIYDSTINVYIQKFEQDQKIRQIEADKTKKQKEAEELIKIKKEDVEIGLSEEQLIAIEKQRQREKEIQNIRNDIEEMTKRADRLGREYEVALRKGKFMLKCPYPEIINIYERAKLMAQEREWNTEVAIFLSQINKFGQKLEKDKRLRQIEAEKVKKQEEVEELFKIKKEEPSIGLDAEKLKLLEEQRRIEEEKKDFEEVIDTMINRAEKMAREYDVAMKKAIKKRNLAENPPFLKIISIYERVRKMLLEKGRDEEVAAYSNQISFYNQKLEKDNKLREVEVQKAEREKALEEMHKVGKKVGMEEKRFKAIERKKKEEEFEKLISENVNRAERMVRDFEMSMRKAYRIGEILESTPYSEVIDIYKQIKDKIDERGWIEQSQIYTNQIKIYQGKLEKHKKLLEVEAQKAQREKDLEDMHKIGKVVEIDQKKFGTLEKKKEEKEFQKYITEMVNKAEKLEREFDSAMKKAIKKGEILESTPYSEVIDIYKQIKDKIDERGWIEQSQIYKNQIKIYQGKLEKHEKLLEVEAQKAQREKDLEDMHKVGRREIKPAKPEKIKELEAEDKEEDILLEKAMNLIDEAEKTVKSYELSIRKDILIYKNPYDKVVSNYEEARELFKKIGWNDESNRLINTIKFYKDKKEKDDKLRAIEQKKLEKSEIGLESVKINTEKEFLERQKRLSEFEEKQKQADETTAEIFDMIQEAEKIAQEYELKVKSGVFDYEAPYEKIINIYRDARKRFEEINWKEESAKLIDTIKFYREKLAQDKKMRVLEAEKVKKREEELKIQQRLLEQARQEQEKLLQKRKESLHLRKERVAQFETQKDKAFRLMDQAKRELRQNNFDKSIESYKESEKIFIDIKWEEGIKMVRDSVVMINSKKKAYELEQKELEERKVKKILIEEKLEEKLAEAQLIRKRQQEEKRKEFLKIQREKEQERQTSEEAYDLLEEGTILMNNGKFPEAYDKFIVARELFQKIAWQREVSRINNELLFKLKREQKQAEILEDIKIKKVEEEKQIVLLKEEAKRERKELEKRRKEERKEEAKRELDRKISIKLDKANKLFDSSRYNEGILIMREEIQRLMKLEKHDEIERINEQINNLKAEAEIPLITVDVDIKESQSGNFIAAYKALDEAQVSATDNRFMKAISELSEAKFKLKELKLGKKIIEEINKKITEFRSKVSKKPLKEVIKAKEETPEDEMEILRKRIAIRREERRKKVLALLGKRE